MDERAARATVDVVDDPTGQAGQLVFPFKLDVAHGAVKGATRLF